MAKKTQTLLFLSSLMLLFYGPLFMASYVLSHKDHYTLHSVHYGTLVTPVVPIAKLKLQPQFTMNHQPTWQLVYILPVQITEQCKQRLELLYNLQLAQHQNQDRLQRTLLVTSTLIDPLLQNHALSTRANIVSLPHWHNLQKYLPNYAKMHTILLVDPLGNIMMAYAANQDMHDIMHDVQRILKVSRI